MIPSRIVLRSMVTFPLLAALVATDPAMAGGSGTPQRHQQPLPQATSSGSARGAVAGQLASPGHPRGTILLAWSLDHLGPALTEWDLANNRVVRQAVLGWPNGGATLARTGSTLHVLGIVDGVRYARVDAATLRPTCQLHVGDGFGLSIASDGALTAIAWLRWPKSVGQDIYITLVDAACARRGELVLPDSPEPSGLAVLGGRAFVVNADEAAAAPQSQLRSVTPSGTIERSATLDVQGAPSLAAAGTRLLLLARNELLEVSPQLRILSRHAVPAPSDATLAVADDGRLLTSDGEVLSPSFASVGSFAPLELWRLAALWVGDVPVILATDLAPLKHVSLTWVDPGAHELGGAP